MLTSKNDKINLIYIIASKIREHQVSVPFLVMNPKLWILLSRKSIISSVVFLLTHNFFRIVFSLFLNTFSNFVTNNVFDRRILRFYKLLYFHIWILNNFLF